ncbi:hypothetical protein DPEC_G00273740 [Dallia pectoralis]|uniref:Uncharacterized protein n=1 Tax=Dallia pectoralis TaxID=75939 RepID=A0ACC2FQJ8_DALPE|nr:hypothetical protein DPEC_G00273740 [Dallia pectoralis]
MEVDLPLSQPHLRTQVPSKIFFLVDHHATSVLLEADEIDGEETLSGVTEGSKEACREFPALDPGGDEEDARDHPATETGCGSPPVGDRREGSGSP